jgi:hypothetical protein
MNFLNSTKKNEKIKKADIFFLFSLVLLLLNFPQIILLDINQVVSSLCVIALMWFFQLLSDRNSRLVAIQLTIGTLLISFLLQISNFQRWLIFLVLIIFAIAALIRINPKQKPVKSVLLTLGIYLILFTIYRVILYFQAYALQFMTFGYDNALHFSLYKSYQITSWYPFVNQLEWASNLSLFQNYPSGQAALFSFLSEIFAGNQNKPLLALCSYFLLLLCNFIGIIYLVRLLIVKFSSGIRSFMAWISAIVIATAFAGVLFVDGFPPYLLGLMLVLLWALTLKFDEREGSQIYVLGVTAFSLSLISPLLIFCILLPATFLFFREIHSHWSSHQYLAVSLRFFYISALGILAILINSMTSSKFGWRQLLAGGGIQPFNKVEAVLIVMSFVTTLYGQRKKLFTNSLSLIALSTLASFSVLAILTIAYTGSIQYYAIKQLYVCLLILTIVVMKYLFEMNQSSLAKILGSTLIIGIFSVSLLYSKVYTTGFMGTMPNAIRSISNEKSWQTSSVDSHNLIRMKGKLNPILQNQCLIFRVSPFESDLNSRWANAIGNSNSTSEACFGAYWNSHMLSDQELISKLKSSSMDYVLIVALSQKENFSSYISKNVSLVLI